MSTMRISESKAQAGFQDAYLEMISESAWQLKNPSKESDGIKKKFKFDKEVWEGWTVGALIDYIYEEIDQAVGDKEVTKKTLEKMTSSAQPYTKKVYPDVVNYFCYRYGCTK